MPVKTTASAKAAHLGFIFIPLLHWYDEDGKRHDAKDVYPEILSDA